MTTAARNFTFLLLSALVFASLANAQNLFVANTNAPGTVSEFTPGGSVSTFASLLTEPVSLAFDRNGNLFVSDYFDHSIWKITPGGSVSNFAQSNSFLDGPVGLAFDSSGNLFVASYLNGTISEVTPSGSVSTFVSGLNGPQGLAFNRTGDLFVSLEGSNSIDKITPGGSVSTFASGFSNPQGLAFDGSGDLFVSNYGSGTISEIAPGGSVSTFVSGLNKPVFLVFDGSGDLFVSNYGNGTISEITPGGLVSTFASGLNGPLGITFAPAVVTVNTPAPSGVTTCGTPITMSINGATGCTYQWMLNGVPIAGATAKSYKPGSVSAGTGAVGTNDSGRYTVQVTDSAGNIEVLALGTLNVVANGWLTNLSARTGVGTSGSILIAGFGVSGSGSKQVMLRAVGPGLASTFGLTGVLATPQLTLYDSVIPTNPQVIASDTAWGNSPVAGPSTLSTSPQKAGATLMATVGAFSLVAGSADSAMVVSAPVGSYTAQVSGVGSTTGVALAEIYDADTGTPPTRLVNISARASVGTGGSILIGGFTITGSTSETILIRGVGPGLASTFNLTGVLATPQLALYDSVVPTNPQVIATATAWGGTPATGPSTVQAGILPASAAVMATVGAFSLVTGSADSAMLVTLPPGNYTVQLSGVSGATGIALMEIYEVP